MDKNQQKIQSNTSIGVRMLIAVIRGYRYLLSPWIGNQCRFYPTCSHYMEQSLATHGVIRGLYFGIKRLLKCHPWHQGGIDPVPKHTCHSTNKRHPL